AFLVLGAVVLAGCASKPRGQAPAPGAPTAGAGVPPRQVAPGQQGPAVQQTEAAEASAQQGAPGSLAAHAESYARNLESLLAKRSTGAPKAAAATKDPGVIPAPATR